MSQASMTAVMQFIGLEKRFEARGASTAVLAAGNSGRVFNMASDPVWWVAPPLLADATSKGAVIGMTRSLARQMGGDAITLNAIAPVQALVEATASLPQARHDHDLNGRAIQRPQIPEDVNAAALFLLTLGSGFITGQLLPVNGGFVMN